MQHRIVLLEGRTSRLLYGDQEMDDRRFIVTDPDGEDVEAALSILLQEGWQIEKIETCSGPSHSAIVLLKRGE